jgi:hypothetical protein
MAPLGLVAALLGCAGSPGSASDHSSGQPTTIAKEVDESEPVADPNRRWLAMDHAGPSHFAVRGVHPCPPEGNAKDPAHRLRNVEKNRLTAPSASDIDSTVTFAAMIAPGDDQDRWSVQAGATIEGIVTDVKVGGNETCNCNATDPLLRDTHIEVKVSGQDSRRPLIVEVTPGLRHQHPDWTTDKLHALLIGKKVRFTGWLFFDNDHQNESTNTASPGMSPAKIWRCTAWEIHPVTSFDVLN